MIIKEEEYRPQTTVAKGAEPTLAVTLLAVIITLILKSKGIEITEEDALQIITMIVASASGIYGTYKMIWNYFKNRNK